MSYHRAATVEQVCATCGQTFELPRYEQSRRAGRYCSWACNLGRPTRQQIQRVTVLRDSRVPAVLADLELGIMTTREIAEKHGVTRQRVDQIAKQAGITGVSPHARTRAIAQAVIDAGGDQYAVAERLGFTLASARTLLKRLGGTPSKRPPLRFCKNGHDRQEVGTYGRSACKACHRAYVEGWKQRNPERARLSLDAPQIISRAIKKGLLTRPSICEQCGKGGRIEAAHYDYSQPLNVRWLCVSCHRRWDKAEPKTLVA